MGVHRYPKVDCIAFPNIEKDTDSPLLEEEGDDEAIAEVSPVEQPELIRAVSARGSERRVIEWRKDRAEEDYRRDRPTSRASVRPGCRLPSP